MDCNVKLIIKDIDKIEYRAPSLNGWIETKLQRILSSVVRNTTVSDLLDTQSQAEKETQTQLNSYITELGLECTSTTFTAIVPPPNITRAYEELVHTRMLRKARLESSAQMHQTNLNQRRMKNEFQVEQTELLIESYKKTLERLSTTLTKEEAVKAAEALSRPNFFAPYECIANGMKEIEATHGSKE